jgi:hypothetical protein
MSEYLIRTIDDEEFDIPFSKWKEVFRPITFDSKVIEGWGMLRLEVSGCEISFSPEPPGTHIIFENENLSSANMNCIVTEILESAEDFTNKKGKIIEL